MGTKWGKHFVSDIFSFLTYDLSIRAEYWCVLPHRGASWHETNSLPGRLSFDLRYDDVSPGEILGLTPTFSLVSNRNNGINGLAFNQGNKGWGQNTLMRQMLISFTHHLQAVLMISFFSQVIWCWISQQHSLNTQSTFNKLFREITGVLRWFITTDGPDECGLHGSGRLVDVVAVETEPRLQSQTVSGTETSQFHLAVSQELVRHLHHSGLRDRDLGHMDTDQRGVDDNGPNKFLLLSRT